MVNLATVFEKLSLLIIPWQGDKLPLWRAAAPSAPSLVLVTDVLTAEAVVILRVKNDSH